MFGDYAMDLRTGISRRDSMVHPLPLDCSLTNPNILPLSTAKTDVLDEAWLLQLATA